MRRLSRNSGCAAAAAIFAVISIVAVHWSVAAASSPSVVVGLAGDFFFPMETECRGSIGECSMYGAEEKELEMEWEKSRRNLAAKRYISYDSLERGYIPCSRRGASYYNCQRGAQANPYSRGCTIISRCRR